MSFGSRSPGLHMFTHRKHIHARLGHMVHMSPCVLINLGGSDVPSAVALFSNARFAGVEVPNLGGEFAVPRLPGPGVQRLFRPW